MQYNDTPLSFLREKIQEIKVALFKSEINSELSLPNNIIETISTDPDGNVYFFTSCRGNYAAQIDQPFYAYLEYHKKGTDTKLRISGKAIIVKDEADVASPENEEHGINTTSIVLVKMKIMQAEYFGQPAHHNDSWTQKLRSTFTHLFSPSSGEQHYNFG
ncbi:MAG: pyridoxamine 5'-phosphate oxidase family protein [Ferruginibacter sp.]